MFVGFLISCSDTVQPDIKELVMENIEENSFILDQAFARTTQILQAQGKLEGLVASSATRDAFITKMNDLVQGAVQEAVGTYGKTFTITVGDAGASHHNSIQNNLKQIAVGIHGPNPGSGALELYSKEITDKLDLLQGEILLVENHLSRQGKQIPIESYNFSFGSSAIGGRVIGSTTDLTLDRFDVKLVKETIGNIIISYDGLEDLDKAIEDFVADNPDTEILIGLLLPAVQAPRVNLTGNVTFYTHLSNIVFGNLITPERKAWDQQVRYAAFLAAVDFIISEDYNNENEDHASIPLQDAMHHAVCVLTWSKIYDLYK